MSLVLYLRSRQVVGSSLAAGVCAGGMAVPTFTADLMAVFAVASSVAVAGVSLGTPDRGLDLTASLPWRRRRAGHVLAVGVLAVVLGLLLGPADLVVRNAVGLTGLAALAAAVLGGGLAWTLPLGWTVVAAVAALGSARPAVPVLTWLLQPADVPVAAVVAVVLGVVGSLVYVLVGPRDAF